MESIAFYGKGGVGKSFISANISYYLASRKRRVLHIGCDPKHDSTFLLLKENARVSTVLDIIGDNIIVNDTYKIINEGKMGIDCIEAGGPPPGVGCAGRGVARTLEFIEEIGITRSRKYNAVIYDVLGDVVCGGFAAPLRLGFAKKVVIVTSEEGMSIYATNNIVKAVNTYFDNGISLVGLVVNLRNNDADRNILLEFARRLNTEILGFIRRSILVFESETERKTIFEKSPRSEEAKEISNIAERIYRHKPKHLRPTPMSESDLLDFIKRR